MSARQVWGYARKTSQIPLYLAELRLHHGAVSQHEPNGFTGAKLSTSRQDYRLLPRRPPRVEIKHIPIRQIQTSQQSPIVAHKRPVLGFWKPPLITSDVAGRIYPNSLPHVA